MRADFLYKTLPFLLLLSKTAWLQSDPGSGKEARKIEDEVARSSLRDAADYLYDLSTTAPQMREQRVKTDREPRSLAGLPEDYRQLEPVKIGLTIKVSKHDEKREMQRTIMRTSDKVYMNYEGQGQEWLFEKNPLDPRRVSGRLIDHRQNFVLQYYDSELHNFGIVSSWTDVVTLGVKLEELETLRSTGKTESLDGIPFLHYTSKTEDNAPPGVEIWWSEAKALPLRIIRRKGDLEWSQELTSLEWRTDELLLAQPTERYPEYQALDYVDWQEEYHGNEESNDHGHHH